MAMTSMGSATVTMCPLQKPVPIGGGVPSMISLNDALLKRTLSTNMLSPTATAPLPPPTSLYNMTTADTTTTTMELFNVAFLAASNTSCYDRQCSLSTASETDSSSTVSSKRSRVVTFSLAPTIVHSYEKDYWKDEKHALWYGKAEIQAMVEQEKQAVQLYIQQHPSYVTCLLQIWATPCLQAEVLQRLVGPIQDSPLRGLEKHCLYSMKQRRGVVLKKVLQAQTTLYQSVRDPQERAELLRQDCQPWSRTSARFARAMALGDEAAVSSSSIF